MKLPKLPDKVYDVLKWVLLIVVPAFNSLLELLAVTWGWNIPTKQIIITVSGFAAFFGAILGISSAQYNKEKKAE